VIVIHPYKASWPSEFAEIRAHLAGVLGDSAKRIAHIGSTSVQCLAAKDIIDVQIGVDDLAPALSSALSAAGYEFVAQHSYDHIPEGEVGSSEQWKKLYFRGCSGARSCHIHVRVCSNPNHRYALLFRDYLRSHQAARMTVALVKRELARLHGNDADAYYAIKDPVYDLIWQAANEWAEYLGWRQDDATDA
jgi:GrpB-like predicted nucleotidyltransferase (UPF0157 family)